jgi:UDP-glucose 4-epimerase
MHFAAFTYVGESVEDPQKYYMNNVKNTLNLLQVMLEENVKRFVFSSTCATYGNPVEIPITENHPQNPINPYGRGKLIVEQILKDYSDAYGLKYASLRYFNAAGADPDCEIGELHDPETHLIPLVLDAASAKREDIKIFGTDYDTPDGTCIRDYIHVTDLADAHILALEYLNRGGNSDVFNLGNGSGFSVKEVIETARKITGKQIKEIEVERRPGDPPILIGSSKKAMEILKWKPKYHDLSQIIETAWKWHETIAK